MLCLVWSALIPAGERGAAVAAELAACVGCEGRGVAALDIAAGLVRELGESRGCVPGEGDAQPE